MVMVAVSATTAVRGQPLLTVRDPENRFTIGVPGTWHVDTSTPGGVPVLSAKAPAPNGQLSDSVYVTVEDFATPITPSACASRVAVVMWFIIHTWTTLKEGPTTLDRMPAYTREYVWRTGAGASRRSVQICVTLGPRAFLLIGTTADTPTAVQQDLPQIERIMATFRPVPPLFPLPPPSTRLTPGQNR